MSLPKYRPVMVRIRKLILSREQGISSPLTVMPEMWRPTDGMTSSRQKRIRLIPEKMVRFLKMAAARQERQTVLINPPQEAVPVLPERHPAPTNPPEAATAVTAAVENRMPIKATAAKIIMHSREPVNRELRMIMRQRKIRQISVIMYRSLPPEISRRKFIILRPV